MYLEDASSKEEVVQALEAGDEEMKESIAYFLKATKKEFERDRWSYLEHTFPDWDDGINSIVTGNDKFTDLVIENSPVDLSVVPRTIVEDAIDRDTRTRTRSGGGRRDYTTWGPFTMGSRDDRGGPRVQWAYELTGQASQYFSDGNYPDADLALLIPEDIAEAFWADLAKDLGEREWVDGKSVVHPAEWMEDTSVLGTNSCSVESGYFYIGPLHGETEFAEFCNDILREYIDKTVKQEPQKVLDIFIKEAIPESATKVRSLLAEAGPTEDVMDYVVQWFSSSGDKDEQDSERAEIVELLTAYLKKTLAPEELIIDFMDEALPELGESADAFREALANKVFNDDEILGWAEAWFEGDSHGVKDDIKKELTKVELRKDPAKTVSEFMIQIKPVLTRSSGAEGFELLTKAIEEKHFSPKNVLDIAVRYLADDGRSVIERELSDYIDAVVTSSELPSFESRDAALKVTKADLTKLGITSGPLFEEAPLKLITLKPSELGVEGRRMRHCVGDSPSYACRIQRGEIEIWSLRNRANKPLFTLEVDSNFHKHTGPNEDLNSQRRATAIRQLKGKANRTPGYTERRGEFVASENEVKLWRLIFKKLKVAPEYVVDFSAHNITPKTELPDDDNEVAASARRHRKPARG